MRKTTPHARNSDHDTSANSGEQSAAGHTSAIPGDLAVGCPAGLAATVRAAMVAACGFDGELRPLTTRMPVAPNESDLTTKAPPRVAALKSALTTTLVSL